MSRAVRRRDLAAGYLAQQTDQREATGRNISPQRELGVPQMVSRRPRSGRRGDGGPGRDRCHISPSVIMGYCKKKSRFEDPLQRRLMACFRSRWIWNADDGDDDQYPLCRPARRGAPRPQSGLTRSRTMNRQTVGTTRGAAGETFGGPFSFSSWPEGGDGSGDAEGELCSWSGRLLLAQLHNCIG
jgi:hypothetical protein